MSVPTEQTLAHLRNNRPVYDMTLPFDPNVLLEGAQRRGMTKSEAQQFAHLALRVVREIYAETGRPVTAGEFARRMAGYAREKVEEARKKEEIEREERRVEDSVILGMEGEVEKMGRKRLRGVEIEETEENGGRRKRFKFSQDLLEKFFDGKDPYGVTEKLRDLAITPYQGQDILSSLCENIEIATNIGTYLPVKDILNLYAISKTFHHTVNGHLLSTIRTWVDGRCPEAGRVFSYQLYKRHLVPDPSMRTWAQQYNIPGSSVTLHSVTKLPSPGTESGSESSPRRPAYSKELHQTRAVPGMKYLQLVTNRSRFCSEILAILARNGHRTPATMHATLLRLWFLLEIPTSTLRQSYLRNKAIWTDIHLYNAQMLFIKLGMHFNDPVYGPNTYELLHLMLGQKGLYPLWQLLLRKKFTRLSEVLELRVRYDFQVPPDHWGGDYFDRTVHNVPFAEIGVTHLEGWGKGTLHLMRPDELIPMEAVTRGLALEKHLMQMVVWGYIVWKTGENLVPSEEEMWIEDEEEVLRGVDTHHHWKRRHVLKKRFGELSEEHQEEIRAYDEDERLRAMGWCGDRIDDYDSPYDSEEDDEDGDSHASLDDEIERGYILRSPQRESLPLDVRPPPGAGEVTAENATKWREYSNEVLIGMVPSLGEDEALRAQAWCNGSGAEWEVEERERREEVARRRRGVGVVGFEGGEALFVQEVVGVGDGGEEMEEDDEEGADIVGVDVESGLSDVDGDDHQDETGVLDEEASSGDEDEDSLQHSPFDETEENNLKAPSAGSLRECTPDHEQGSSPPAQGEHLTTPPPVKKSGFTPINSPSQAQTAGQALCQGSPRLSSGALESDHLLTGLDAGDHQGGEEEAGERGGDEQDEVAAPKWAWPQGMEDGDDGGYDSEASTVRIVSYEGDELGRV